MLGGPLLKESDIPAQYKCPVCSFTLWVPIVDFEVSSLGLYNDARFPGRCILVLKQHEEDFASLSRPIVNSFIADTQRSGRAIQAAVGAERMNYAVLGNVESHVHMHIIPRQLNGKERFSTPWDHPDRQSKLPDSEVQKLRMKILRELR
jgi:diadenosine tetraphosphate (Ap4A) HIT family hydrolase